MSNESTTTTSDTPTITGMTDVKTLTEASVVALTNELEQAIRTRSQTNTRIKALRAELTIAGRVLRQYEPPRKRKA